MSIPYERHGRINQKTRTREGLLAATRELFGEGVTPTVEQAADRARVSRTTAYRYFPNQRSLVVAAYPEIERTSRLDDDAPPDPAARLEIVVKRYTSQVVNHEPELRAQLRIALEPDAAEGGAVPLRKGRAIGWIEDALQPLSEHMSQRELHRLAIAIRATSGIEAFVWLRDVAGLSRKQAIDLMRQSAMRLFQAAMAEASLLQQRPARDNRSR